MLDQKFPYDPAILPLIQDMTSRIQEQVWIVRLELNSTGNKLHNSKCPGNDCFAH